MKRVLIRGPLTTRSGYSVHARQIYRWAESHADWDLTTQLLPWGITSWILDPTVENGIIGRIIQHSKQIEGIYDLSFQIQLPNEWDPNLARVNVGVTALVETDICNPLWIDSMNKMTCVVVPTNHTKTTIMRTAAGKLQVPVFVIPESFPDAITQLKAADVNPLLDLDTSFNFLMVGQITGNNIQNDRKNTFNSVKWICETFADKHDVGIVLKTNMGKDSIVDRSNTINITKSAVSSFRKGLFPKIHLLHGSMTDSEMALLYRHPKIRAFVALTKGEGFGLPILEAAASGLPVVATNWSGHLDFMGKGKFIPVNYNIEEIHPTRVDDKIFVKGSKWAEPLESDAKQKLLKFYNKPDVPKQWASDLRDVIQKQYSFEAISSVYNKVLQELIKP